MPASSAADVYDGTIPFPDTGAGSLPIGGPVQVAVTSVIAVTSARHGVGWGQIDLSAGLIALFERIEWATDVRWPSPERVESRRRAASPGPGDAPAADEVTGTPGREPERAPAPATR